jgi:hypothetical protein
MSGPDADDALAADTFRRWPITRESEGRRIPDWHRFSACPESQPAITSDGALVPNWREQLRRLAAVVELQRGWGCYQREP